MAERCSKKSDQKALIRKNAGNFYCYREKNNDFLAVTIQYVSS